MSTTDQIPPTGTNERSDGIAPPETAAHFERLRFDAAELPIAREYVLKGVEINPERKAHQRWLPVVDDYLTRLRRVLRPRALIRIDAVRSLEARRLELASGAAYRGAVGQFLRGSAYVATFVVTIGSAAERLARRGLKGTRIMEGAIVDSIASEAVEGLAELMQQRVEQWARSRQLAITPRYSPGYCGMLVTQQRPLFASLPTDQIRVRLTESCLMLPIKSVSGLIGIAPADVVAPFRFPCETCDHPDCMQRRKPFNRELMAEFDWSADEFAPDPLPKE